jgi:hypothetical protein
MPPKPRRSWAEIDRTVRTYSLPFEVKPVQGRKAHCLALRGGGAIAFTTVTALRIVQACARQVQLEMLTKVRGTKQ